MRSWLRRTTSIAACALVVCLRPAAQELPRTPASETLRAGPARERAMAAGDSHFYSLPAEAGQHIRVIVEQQGVDVVVSIKDQAGEALAVADGPPAIVGFERIAIVAGTAQPLSVEVRAQNAYPDRGSYRISLADVRSATDRDRAAVSAEHLIAEGERLRMTANLANLGTARARFESALPLARQAADPLLEGDALTGIGRCWQDLREMAKAFEPFEQARAKYVEAGARDREAALLNFLALAYEYRTERPRALELLDRALVLAREAGDVRTEALTFNNMGMTWFQGGDKDRGLEKYQAALPLHERAGNRKGLATTLANIGTLYDTTGDKAAALDYLQRSLPLRQRNGDRRDLAATLNNMGTVYRALDDYPRALERYREAVPHWQAAGDRMGEGASIHNIASVVSVLGDKQQAIDRYREALRLHRAAAYVTGEANILTNLGLVYAELGDRERAIATYQEAAEKHKAAGNRAGESSTLVSLGTGWLDQGDSTRAMAAFERARELALQVKDPGREASALTAMGRAQLIAGDPAASRASYELALERQRAVGSKRGEAQVLLGLGAVDASGGDPISARRRYEAARDLYHAIAEPAGEARALYRMAAADRDAGRLAEALDLSRAARALAESIRYRVASTDLRSTYLAAARAYYELEIDVLMRLHTAAPNAGHDAEAFDVSERARARSLLEVLADAGATPTTGIDPALAARERALTAAVSAKADRRTRLLSGVYSAEQAESALKEVTAATRELDDVRADMRAKGPGYAALTDTQPLALAAVRADLLDPSTTLIEYVLTDDRSYVWVLTARDQFSVALPPRRVIEAAVRTFIESVRTPAATGWDSAGRALSDLILAPIADRLGSGRLVVVADGALQYIPFEALPVAARGGVEPLLLTHEVISAPSASIIASIRRAAARPRASQTLAIFADPVFSADDVRVQRGPAAEGAPSSGVTRVAAANGGPADAGFARLIGSRREAAAILALAPADSSRRMVDFAASRDTALGPDLSRYRFLHFATHGFLDTAQPELSGLVLSLVDEKGQPQNGFVRLPDIYNLRLGADLVVLSACQSALGREIHGEGMIGLVRGFMSAGASRVVASLWQVDDRATTELMTAFYRSILGPRPKSVAAALRDAQLAVRAQPRWQSPYYWAGFTLQGDWK